MISFLISVKNEFVILCQILKKFKLSEIYNMYLFLTDYKLLSHIMIIQNQQTCQNNLLLEVSKHLGNHQDC
jgi:hypothetical protein